MDSTYPSYYNPPPQYGYQVGLHQLPTPTHTAASANSDDAFSNSPPASSFEYHTTFDPFNHPAQYNSTPIGKPQPAIAHQVDQKPSFGNPNGAFDPIDANGNVQQGSNSDDDDRSPAQSRRKAQNRAAQRAFRERKERHVKDLEAKLATLEKNSANMVEENERLKLQIQKKETENEILKATSAQPGRNGSASPQSTGPMKFSPTDFYTEVLYAHDNKTPSHRIVTSESGERLYAAGATWDYIIKHPLYSRGLVDVGDVSERLKLVAKCDGQGPVFEEHEILRAIEQSVASGNDELL
ncbi:hypothetical protein BJ875DRAFT_378507 [Amylocarpus encephaloides]|uniref:BZIP domain-containing protein n=1 Tax=Amylocarpus encephaloides TaxID=45428 RepID=A0A9P7YHA4_9HELO|nr:hypothetical protein BJ875DRAFT_378507 [Amylocarpus encephaloides]